ncbi:hypothetical protein MKEN_00138700 [Mycena kentingensis (nom. inval.)]|nr:hypothetical protein MKEN_00138700 [Mycena kentingensis (nom. inval.)]
MSTRRPPQCKKCNLPCKGHLAERCIAAQLADATDTQQRLQPLVDRNTLATPPVSPPAPRPPYRVHAQLPTTPTPGPSRNINMKPPIPIPMPNIMGVDHHWRDPTWAPQPAVKPVLRRRNSNDSSLVPTVLVDSDGHTIQGPESAHPASPAPPATAPLRPRTSSASVADSASEEDDDRDDNANSVFDHAQEHWRMKPLARMLGHPYSGEPVLSIMRVRVIDLPRMQMTAGQAGLYTATVRGPAPWGLGSPQQTPTQKQKRVNLKQETDVDLSARMGFQWSADVWVVVGDNFELVHRMAEVHHQKSDFERVPESLEERMVPPRTNYQHIIIASTVSTLLAGSIAFGAFAFLV